MKWGLRHIGRLPNPDPSDTEPWNPTEAKQVIEVGPAFEFCRGVLRQQAQEWAGLDLDSTAELFVFIGRWSKQKGVDLIADVFPSVLERHPKAQLICIGPTVDLYGKFAALKLDEIMKIYPGRVYSKPEYTAVPPFIFTGAEFALIPSRDEPFGLVAVEFGRKGALGVGARVGGLGSLPGWWYTVESTTTKHLHHQFKKSIEDAVSSKTEMRAMMRAQSATQQFPVAKWAEELDQIYSIVMRTSCGERQLRLRLPSRFSAHPVVPTSFSEVDFRRDRSGTRSSPSSLTANSRSRSRSNSAESPANESPISGRPTRRVGATSLPPEDHLPSPGTRAFSILSFDEAVGNRKDFSLQKTDPTFKDTNEKYYRAFQNMLHKLDGKTSEGHLCIENYLIESEMEWNKKRREAKLDRGRASKAPSPDGSIYIERRGSSLASLFGWTSAAGSESSISHEQISESSTVVSETDEFMLDDDHDHESFLKRWIVTKVLGWPIYSLLLVLGQIIAANSYQITLLTGSLADSGEETSEKLYILGTIYVATSCMWWLMFRSFKSTFALSLPFFFYGLSFLLIGILASLPGGVSRDWMARAATGVYVTASSSGSLFTALNFGAEGKWLAPDWLSNAYFCSRWSNCQVLGLSGFNNSRNATNTSGRFVLLGPYRVLINKGERKCYFNEIDCHRAPNIGTSLFRRHSPLLVSSTLLSPKTWQNSCFLHFPTSSTNYCLVLHRCRAAKLLSLNTIW